MNYFVCEIAGRQYVIKPGQTIEVNKLKEEKTLKVDRVLLKVDGDKVEFGAPYLKETVELEVLETIKKDKIRVAKYSPKANSRRVKGSRAQMTLVKLAAPKAVASAKKEAKA